MPEFFWRLLAKLLAWPPIASRIIERARRTPYEHLTGYMHRWWLFNPYDPKTHKARAALAFGEYHHISQVSPGGVITLFITGPNQGMWGFLVDGVKVPWRRYLGLED